MARPKKETIDYFPHFVAGGKTLFILENTFGNDGYAFWFKLLEILGSVNGHVYDCRNSAEWMFLVAKTRVSEQTATEILKTLADLGAIDSELWEQKIIWVQHLIDNVADVYKKRNMETPKKPVFGTETPVKHEFPSQDGSENTQSKVKESKVKESKGENSVSETETLSLDLIEYYGQMKPGESIVAHIDFLKISIEDYGFDWTKEALKLCIKKKGKFIKPWIETVLKNWKAEGGPNLEKQRGQPGVDKNVQDALDLVKKYEAMEEEGYEAE